MLGERGLALDSPTPYTKANILRPNKALTCPNVPVSYLPQQEVLWKAPIPANSQRFISSNTATKQAQAAAIGAFRTPTTTTSIITTDTVATTSAGESARFRRGGLRGLAFRKLLSHLVLLLLLFLLKLSLFLRRFLLALAALPADALVEAALAAPISILSLIHI